MNSNSVLIYFLVLLLVSVSLFFSSSLINNINGISDLTFSVKADEEYNLDVYIQDQTSEIIDYYFTRSINNTFLTSVAVINTRLVFVDDVDGAVISRAINIYDGDRFFQARITSVGVNNVSFNAPLDNDFGINSVVEFADWNMAVDASVVAQEYSVCSVKNEEWDIVRSLWSISDNSPMDTSLFGGIPALTNGAVLRINNGYQKNIFVISDNGGFAERNYDITYSSKAPAGAYGFISRRTFGGQNKNGVVIRLDGKTNDCLSVIINDDLSGLTKFAAVAQGHVVI